MIYYLLLGYILPGFISAVYLYYIDIKYEEFIDRTKDEKRVRTKSFRTTDHYQKTKSAFRLLTFSSLLPIYNILLCLYSIYAVPKLSQKFKEMDI